MPSSDANVRGASACAANANLVVCSTSIDMLEKLVPSYLRAASCVSLTLSQTTHIFKKEFPNCVKRSRERAKNAQVSLLPTWLQQRCGFQLLPGPDNDNTIDGTLKEWRLNSNAAEAHMRNRENQPTGRTRSNEPSSMRQSIPARHRRRPGMWTRPDLATDQV